MECEKYDQELIMYIINESGPSADPWGTWVTDTDKCL